MFFLFVLSIYVLALDLFEKCFLVLDLSLPKLEFLMLLIEGQKLLSLNFEFVNDAFLLRHYTLQLFILALEDFVIRFESQHFRSELGGLVKGIGPLGK